MAKLVFGMNARLDTSALDEMRRCGVEFDKEGIIRWPVGTRTELDPGKGFGVGLGDTRAWYRVIFPLGSVCVGISSGLSGQYVAGVIDDRPGRVELDINRSR